MHKKRITILFWGPLGKRGKTTIGGGESGNRRTIDMISNNGIKVIEIPKPYPPKCKIFSPPLYFLSLLISIARFGFYCFKTDTRIDVAHVSAFYSHLVYFELLMMILAKINRIPFVYEIRGGAMLTVYRKRSCIYRFVFDFVLRGSSAIFSQGLEYVDFIRKKAGKNPVFYPNYVDVKHLDYEMDSTRERAEQVGIIYFGRLHPDKGLEIGIRACKKLSSAGFKYRLHIIGDGPLPFKEQIFHLSESLGIRDRISFYPPMSFPELKKVLLRMHFFLFPTRNRMEGHSNALTEAMAFGVVPICSGVGFNKSVVGQCGKVLTDAEPSVYAHAIQALWENGEWGKLSRQCIKRIMSQFLSNIIIPRIINKYNELVAFRS